MYIDALKRDLGGRVVLRELDGIGTIELSERQLFKCILTPRNVTWEGKLC